MDLIRPSGDFKVKLTDRAWVNVFRSNPNVRSDNNDCLVSVYYNNDSDSCVLQSGDYVYKHMNKDMSSYINSLGGIQYTAIVVPHHGDKQSASEVYSPKIIDSSVAFFSAGDHHYYNHPTCESKVAHSKKGFKVIKNTRSMKIIAVQLA